ncbi:MAG: esterase/lipase family protein [Sphingorhabdus sp.]
MPRAIYALVLLPFQWPRLSLAAKGDQRPVFVIPGFGTTDRSTVILRYYLQFLGYRVYAWELGRNLGAKTIGLHNERLLARLDEVYLEERQPVTLIGWSMGGIMARMIARVNPYKIREVISLGAPFTGDPYANTAWKIYERLSGHSLAHPVAQAQIKESKLPLPVPACSIYSKSDGVVSWQTCLEPDTKLADNIAVRSAHCGFGFTAVVLRAVAERLASTGEHASRRFQHRRTWTSAA